MAVESFPASGLRTKKWGAKVSPAPDQPRPSIGSRSLLIVNSILSDWRWRQAFNLREVTVFREPLEVFRRKLSGSDAQSGEFLADEWVSKHTLLKRSRGQAGRQFPGTGKKTAPAGAC